MILDESGFSAGMDKAVKQLGKFDGQVENTSQRGGRSLGGIWTSFVGNFLASGATKIISTGIGMITSSVGTAINRVDTLNNSNRVFENMGFSANETAKAMKNLDMDIKGLPTTLDGAVKGVQLLSSTTGDLGKAEQVFTALNNGILGFGGNAEMVDSAVLQLSQAFSNGKVDAGTWNSMMNAQLGPTLNALAKQMGYTTGELKSGLSEGSISVEQFQDALIDLNKNGGGGLESLEQIAKDSTAGLQTGLANMKSAIVRGVAEAIVKIDEGLAQYGTSISQILADIGSGFENGLKTAAEKIPPIMKAISDAFAFVKENGDWLIPILVGLTSAFVGLGTVNKVASTISSISSALGILKGAAAFLVSGPGLIIVGISLLIAAGVALYKNWDELSKYAKKIWGDLSKYFKETFDNIKKWFSETWTGFKDKAKEASDGVKNAWNGTKQWFSDLWEGVKQSTSNKWNKIKELFSPYVEGILSVFEPMIEWFGTLWETIKTITGAAWEIIKSVIMAPVLFIIDLITGDFTQLKEDMNMIWTNIKEQASIIWEALKQYFFKTIEAIVQTAINLWNSFLDGVVIIWESIVKIGKDIWNLFKNWLIETITKIVNGAKEKWENLKKETVGTFNKLVDGAKQAWEDLKQSVRDVVDRVTGTFDKLSDIDLWEAGKAIIDGFIKGLQQKWEDGKKFVSGIGDWIRKNKGPIEYDRKLLVNNGMAIMDGLNKGIRSGFENVKKTVRGAAGELNNEFNSNLGTPQFNVTGKAAVVSKPNETVLANDLPSNKTKQGDVFNINLQSLGELSEVQLMRMAEQLVKYIKDVKDREDAPKGGPVYGI
ncbi:phage tail protein [Vagococcus carniphilus]